jgi:hypothetical protein
MMFDYFSDWMVDIIPRNYDQVDDGAGSWSADAVDSPTVKAVLYNRSAAERLFSKTWSEDISDVAVVNDITNITSDSFIVYNGLEYEVDSVVNVGEQSEVYTVGLKVKK